MESTLFSLAMGASLLAELFRLVVHKISSVDGLTVDWNKVQVQVQAEINI
jgi:hypothetical protein